MRLIWEIYEWPVVGAGIAQLEECLGGWTAGSRRVERAYRVRRKKTSSPTALASVLASTSRSEPWVRMLHQAGDRVVEQRDAPCDQSGAEEGAERADTGRNRPEHARR